MYSFKTKEFQLEEIGSLNLWLKQKKQLISELLSFNFVIGDYFLIPNSAIIAL